jgi:hypothetical protein
MGEIQEADNWLRDVRPQSRQSQSRGGGSLLTMPEAVGLMGYSRSTDPFRRRHYGRFAAPGVDAKIIHQV